ncbi:MarR family winged helix-turn-helix transcriptional regulator [Vulcaniibacterium tengchongense]|uniref:Transcriptional regulator n=1 Tax=Vulcaniibacterium tengchongense TaxID=1273429 RepID=A0A3N4V2T6_9GAMM|nr:MarR family winged helix-turn-helix transcriptional regulator [Vulcaniibacterium tengchongense]RPE77276.1 transcriptional regulator [Vulcaniibacterium tengchongense]
MDPTPTSSPCTCFRLRKLARLLSQRYDRELAPAGLNINQYSILRRAKRAPEPRTIGELARELGMDRTTLSRDLKPLIASGWVALVDGDDARQRRVRVTAAGARAIERALPLWRRAQDAIGRSLGESGVAALHRQLDRAIERLQGADA